MLETLSHESPIGILIRQSPNQVANMSSNIRLIPAPSIRCHN